MRKIFILSIIMITTSCSLVPEFYRPEMNLPEQWREGKTTPNTNLVDWWFRFKSLELIDLQEKVLKQNLDLRAARARIEQTKAAERIVNAVFFPQADILGSVARTGGNAATHRSTGTGGVDISYELDLFGANRASKISAQAGTESSLFDRDALALIVSSNVAKTYASILALKSRLHVAEKNRDNAKGALNALTTLFKEGANSVLEVEQQKISVANADASIATLQNSLTTEIDALAVLLGATSQDFEITADGLDSLEVPSIAPGQPSSLLERRPDIRKAEADLIAANADIGVARAAFFPSVNLGLATSISTTPLSSPATTALSLASSLSAPLFKGGSILAGVAKSKARKEELAENYRHTILTAFQEVEDALAAIKSSEKRRKVHTDAVSSASKAYDITRQRFKAGAVDYLSLLESESRLLATEDNLISANLDRLIATIDLYKALGGGWKNDMSAPIEAVYTQTK